MLFFIFRSNANVAIKSRMKEGVEKSAPSFGRPLGDVECDEGQKLRITTPIKGNPIPEFSWTKDGQPLTGDRVHSFSDGELVSIFKEKFKAIHHQIQCCAKCI